MLFSVIYWFDCHGDVSVQNYNPPQRHLWQLTEGDESYDYDYLGEEYAKGKHRKWVAVLTRKQFDRFVSDCNLWAEETETGGSLGAPGLGLGLSPAIRFQGEDIYRAIDIGAYVTPVPEVCTKRDGQPFGKRDWERVRRAVLSYYA